MSAYQRCSSQPQKADCIAMDSETKWSRLPYNDIETGAVDASTAVRNGFIKKVFGILSMQLLMTSLIASIFIASRGMREFISQNVWTLFLAIILSFGLLIALSCIPNATRSYPTNYILLFSFTVVEGYLVGAITATYQVEAVLTAFFLTAAVALALTAFAMQTKYDFTTWGGVLLSLLVILVLTGFIAMLFPKSRTFDLLYAGIGALLFGAYLVYDVQIVAGGKQYELSVDDYVPAALTIYLDVINLFLFILRLVGDRR